MGVVFLVDDDHDLRETMTQLLVEEGYGVETAADGAQALTRLRALAVARELPTLVVLDWVMPIMGGDEVVRAIDRDPALAPIPVLILSAVSDPLPPVKHRVLRKPVDLDALLDAVKEHSGTFAVRRS